MNVYLNILHENNNPHFQKTALFMMLSDQAEEEIVVVESVYCLEDEFQDCHLCSLSDELTW